jgi:integrase
MRVELTVPESVRKPLEAAEFRVLMLELPQKMRVIGNMAATTGLRISEVLGLKWMDIRGIYDYPRFSKLLDQSLSPDIDQVARALARKFRWCIQPTGATALNFLGLSTQVPARAVYLSDGPDRVYQIDVHGRP